MNERSCLGYGRYEGKCTNRAGTPWGPHWCMRCDKLRLDAISKGFKEIAEGFAARAAAKEVGHE